jgi:hypothetical protein
MRMLAERLESAGKWAVFPALLLVVVSAVTRCGALLVGAFLFLAPAYLLPSIADWLRTRAVLVEIRSRNRAIAASVTTLPPPRTVTSAIPRDPGPSQDGGDDWLEPPVEWDSLSRSIH